VPKRHIANLWLGAGPRQMLADTDGEYSNPQFLKLLISEIKL
jgi:hypothetical protein